MMATAHDLGPFSLAGSPLGGQVGTGPHLPAPPSSKETDQCPMVQDSCRDQNKKKKIEKYETPRPAWIGALCETPKTRVNGSFQERNLTGVGPAWANPLHNFEKWMESGNRSFLGVTF